ncbi:hypothetical protein KXX13_005402 [Aspergillus fumigatus]|nr:hypothetical protein KXX68_005281 [Aspergillus fumigatus]KAH1446323.1 hypothetical protein KXX13_005402 [Aspergillus fumigatus]KAH1481731.1 hypothetical protein KXX26_007512 [Aspergillus fumigatus]KAH1612155.1 hypothetical protein KXX21_002856 [Aspergillus fumigatus]KAH1742373.1 hypothetical protein KXX41_003106 [Aspergillus fumigatus]
MPASAGSIALALQACGFVFSGNGLLRLLTAEVEDDDCLLIEKVLAEDGNVDDPVYVTSGVKPGTVATYVATPDMILLLSVKDNDLLNCHRFQPHSEEERWIEHPLDTTEPIILHKQSKMTSVSLVSGAHVFFQVPSGALVDLQYQHDTNRWTAQIMRTQVTVQPGSPLCAIQGPSSVSLFFVGDNNCIYYVTRSTVQDASEWEGATVLPGARFEQVPDGLLVVPDEGEPGAFISYVLLGSQLCKVDTTGEKPVGTIGEDGTFYPIDSQESAMIINIYCPTLFINGGLFGGGGAGGYGGGGGGGGWSMRGGRTHPYAFFAYSFPSSKPGSPKCATIPLLGRARVVVAVGEEEEEEEGAEAAAGEEEVLNKSFRYCLDDLILDGLELASYVCTAQQVYQVRRYSAHAYAGAKEKEPRMNEPELRGTAARRAL